MLVEMLFDIKGQDVSDNGVAMQVKLYMSGQRYILGSDLAESFLSQKACILVEKKKPNPPENKKSEPVEDAPLSDEPAETIENEANKEEEVVNNLLLSVQFAKLFL